MSSVFGSGLRYEVSAQTRSKLASARHSLREVQRVWDAYVESGGLTVRADLDTDARAFNLVAEIHRPPPTARSASRFRSAVADMRSCLNNTLYEIARQSGVSQDKSKGRNFPASTDETFWSQVEGKSLRGLPNEVKDRVRKVQPFCSKDLRDPATHPLKILSEVWNDDKHSERLTICPMLAPPDGKALFFDMTGELEEGAAPEELTTELVDDLVQVVDGTITDGSVFAVCRLLRGVIPESVSAVPNVGILGYGVVTDDGVNTLPLPFFLALPSHIEQIVDYLCGIVSVPPAVRPDMVRYTSLPSISALPNF